MECKNCGHELHQGNSGQCPIEDCECINPEPNALDEFLETIGKGKKERST